MYLGLRCWLMEIYVFYVVIEIKNIKKFGDKYFCEF